MALFPVSSEFAHLGPKPVMVWSFNQRSDNYASHQAIRAAIIYGCSSGNCGTRRRHRRSTVGDRRAAAAKVPMAQMRRYELHPESGRHRVRMGLRLLVFQPLVLAGTSRGVVEHCAPSQGVRRHLCHRRYDF